MMPSTIVLSNAARRLGERVDRRDDGRVVELVDAPLVEQQAGRGPAPPARGARAGSPFCAMYIHQASAVPIANASDAAARRAASSMCSAHAASLPCAKRTARSVAALKTGSSQWSIGRFLRMPKPGLRKPAKSEKVARMMSGTVICHGDSCGG